MYVTPLNKPANEGIELVAPVVDDALTAQVADEARGTGPPQFLVLKQVAVDAVGLGFSDQPERVEVGRIGLSRRFERSPRSLGRSPFRCVWPGAWMDAGLRCSVHDLGSVSNYVESDACK